MKILELFSGSGSISKAFQERGHDTFTVDNNPQHNPDLCIDILKMTIKDLPKEFRNPDVVWASPPCTTFSVASIYRYWNEKGNPKSWKTYVGLAIAKKTVELIEELKPKYYFIENPRAMLRKQDFMKKLNRKTVTYCQYGDKVQKPTDIWTNANHWIPKPCCSPGDSCHESAKRGSDRGTQSQNRSPIKRAIIPRKLCKEIVDVCETGQILTQAPSESFDSDLTIPLRSIQMSLSETLR